MKLLNLFILILMVISLPVLSAEQTAEQIEQDKIRAVQKIQILDRPLLMRGMGLTQLMSDDYYIGAFYLDELAVFDDGDDFVYIEVPRRMEFRFASERKISGRGFGRNLAERIRINNTPGNIKAEKANLQKFIRLFRGSYKKGDVISFDYHRDFGTRVYLNSRRLGEIKNSRDLYRLLVKMWVGDRPPSSTFKKGIIGRNDGDYAIELLKRYVSLK